MPGARRYSLRDLSTRDYCLYRVICMELENLEHEIQIAGTIGLDLPALSTAIQDRRLMVEAAEQLTPRQRATAYAVAAEIMRSDGPLQDDERNILTNLATTLDLHEADTAPVLAAMDLLHADVLDG